MTLLSIAPKEFPLTVTRHHRASSRAGYAIYRGDSYYAQGRILDGDGNPLNLGPTGAPLWTPRAQLRLDRADFSPIAASFTAAIVDGPLSDVSWSLTPASSILLTADRYYWDFQIENLADPRAPVGFIQTIWFGPALAFGDYTRA